MLRTYIVHNECAYLNATCGSPPGAPLVLADPGPSSFAYSKPKFWVLYYYWVYG